MGRGRADLNPSASALGLHAERPWEGNRFAENYSEGTGQATTQGNDGSSPQRQPQSQRAGEGEEQLAADGKHRYELLGVPQSQLRCGSG